MAWGKLLGLPGVRAVVGFVGGQEMFTNGLHPIVLDPHVPVVAGLRERANQIGTNDLRIIVTENGTCNQVGQVGKPWKLLLAVVGLGQVGSVPFAVQVFVQGFEANQGGVINDEDLSLLQIPERPIAELPHSENGQVLDDSTPNAFGKPRMIQDSEMGIQSEQPRSSNQ